jgi:hypothetical protein
MYIDCIVNVDNSGTILGTIFRTLKVEDSASTDNFGEGKNFLVGKETEMAFEMGNGYAALFRSCQLSEIYFFTLYSQNITEK